MGEQIYKRLLTLKPRFLYCRFFQVSLTQLL